MPASFTDINKKAGNVKTTPAAIDSPAEPVVWIILFSRIVVLKYFRPMEIARTAIGIEAETVSPAFNARNTDAAPKRIPKNAPIITDFIVNSATFAESAI